jgi:hypothetical protein
MNSGLVTQDQLSTFSENNSHANVRIDDEMVTIESPWGSRNVAIASTADNHSFFRDLENVRLDPAFDAVIHLDTNTVEVLFRYVNPNNEDYASLVDRQFTLHFDGVRFECSFAEPSERLMAIARHTQNVPSDDPGRSVPQIAAFRDAQRLDELPDRAKRYFADKVPRNFYIVCCESIDKIDLPGLMRHINFVTDYYDRRFPEIVIRESLAEAKNTTAWTPRRHIEDQLIPAELSIGVIDEVVLQLISVARHAPSRQAFLYYYQVIEYAGHYFIDERSKSQMRRFLRDPALVNCDERKIRDFLSLFTTQANQGDDAKMKKVIEDIVNPSLIWLEIEHDRDFFSVSQSFDGGFEMPYLISKDMSEDGWKATWMPNLYERLTRMRNSLVHARERRENKVILPTIKNNQLIARYEPVIARMAQQIALGML